jgi:hypothetical protein
MHTPYHTSGGNATMKRTDHQAVLSGKEARRLYHRLHFTLSTNELDQVSVMNNILTFSFKGSSCAKKNRA